MVNFGDNELNDKMFYVNSHFFLMSLNYKFFTGTLT